MEARSPRASLDKKKYQGSTEDLAHAQRLLRDIETLHHGQLAETKGSETPVQKKVTAVDASEDESGSTNEPDSVDDVDVGIHDESIKDEESRALLQRASIFAPITGPAVNMPDEDIVAIVTQKHQEKSHNSPVSHRRPTLSTESVDRRAEATAPAAAGRQSPATSKPSTPPKSKNPSPMPSKRTVQATPKRVSPAASTKSSRASSKSPSPGPSKDVPRTSPAGSPSTSKRSSTVVSRKLIPVPSQINIESVREQTTKVHASSSRGEASSSGQRGIAPPMAQEREELDNVIKDLLKSADAGV